MHKSHKEDHEKQTAKLAGVTMVAAVAGFVAGMLFAPKSGAETRKDIKRKAKKLEKQAHKGADAAREVIEEGKKEFKEVADEVVHDAKELTSDAKVRARRTVEHAKTGVTKVEDKARQAWGANDKTSKK